jgi:thiol:disulfide interchange protein DsbA
MKYLMPLLLTFGLFAAQAQTTSKPQAYNEGLQYDVLDPVYDTDNKEQVVVYEFFGYKCPHCSHFQPFVKPWHEKLPKYVKFVRVPVVFQPGWDILAKAYHTAETMGIADKTHQAMFDAIHKKQIRFRSIEQIAEWYSENFGVDKEAFLSTANSFMIDSKMRQVNNMMRTMKITSTPTLIINGKYKPNVKALGSNNALLDMATFLVDKEAKAMGLTK